MDTSSFSSSLHSLLASQDREFSQFTHSQARNGNQRPPQPQPQPPSNGGGYYSLSQSQSLSSSSSSSSRGPNEWERRLEALEAKLKAQQQLETDSIAANSHSSSISGSSTPDLDSPEHPRKYAPSPSFLNRAENRYQFPHHQIDRSRADPSPSQSISSTATQHTEALLSSLERDLSCARADFASLQRSATESQMLASARISQLEGQIAALKAHYERESSEWIRRIQELEAKLQDKEGELRGLNAWKSSVQGDLQAKQSQLNSALESNKRLETLYAETKRELLVALEGFQTKSKALDLSAQQIAALQREKECFHENSKKTNHLIQLQAVKDAEIGELKEKLGVLQASATKDRLRFESCARESESRQAELQIELRKAKEENLKLSIELESLKSSGSSEHSALEERFFHDRQRIFLEQKVYQAKMKRELEGHQDMLERVSKRLESEIEAKQRAEKELEEIKVELEKIRNNNTGKNQSKPNSPAPSKQKEEPKPLAHSNVSAPSSPDPPRINSLASASDSELLDLKSQVSALQVNIEMKQKKLEQLFAEAENKRMEQENKQQAAPVTPNRPAAVSQADKSSPQAAPALSAAVQSPPVPAPVDSSSLLSAHINSSSAQRVAPSSDPLNLLLQCKLNQLKSENLQLLQERTAAEAKSIAQSEAEPAQATTAQLSAMSDNVLKLESERVREKEIESRERLALLEKKIQTENERIRGLNKALQEGEKAKSAANGPGSSGLGDAVKLAASWDSERERLLLQMLDAKHSVSLLQDELHRLRAQYVQTEARHTALQEFILACMDSQPSAHEKSHQNANQKEREETKDCGSKGNECIGRSQLQSRRVSESPQRRSAAKVNEKFLRQAAISARLALTPAQQREERLKRLAHFRTVASQLHRVVATQKRQSTGGAVDSLKAGRRSGGSK